MLWPGAMLRTAAMLWTAALAPLTPLAPLAPMTAVTMAGAWAGGCGAARATAGAAASAGSDIALSWQIEPAAPAVGRATLRLVLTDVATRRPLAGAAVTVEADMLHPGMAPVLAAARPVAGDRYEAAFDFNMPGDWVLLVDARLADGRSVHREIAVPGVRPS